MTTVRIPSLFGVLFVIVAAGLSMEPRAAFGAEPAPGTRSATAAAPAPIPPLDKLLAQAMDSHPKIVAAQAKVALAQAQLQVLRFQVAQEIIDMNAERTSLAFSLDYHKRALDDMTAASRTSPGAFSRVDLNKAEQAVLEAQTRAAKVDLQLRQILGSVGGAASQPASRGSASTPAPAAGFVPAPQEPRDKEAALQLLGHPCKIVVNDMPLGQLAAYLQDYMRKFYETPPPIFVDEGLGDMPITIELGECAHLADAIQALEDKYPNMKFVVRDYGLFITTGQRAQSDGFMPAVDFWRDYGGDYLASQEPAKPSRSGGPAAKPTSPAAKPAAKPATRGSASDPFGASTAKPAAKTATGKAGDPFGAASGADKK
jgi:hypothetical protein